MIMAIYIIAGKDFVLILFIIRLETCKGRTWREPPAGRADTPAAIIGGKS